VSGERRNAGLVRGVAGSEYQHRFFAVQISELALELDERMIVAGDVAGAAGAGSRSRRRLHHGLDHLRMLTHAEESFEHQITTFFGPCGECQIACGIRPAIRSRSAKTR
jgi:hypothetical protein